MGAPATIQVYRVLGSANDIEAIALLELKVDRLRMLFAAIDNQFPHQRLIAAKSDLEEEFSGRNVLNLKRPRGAGGRCQYSFRIAGATNLDQGAVQRTTVG